MTIYLVYNGIDMKSYMQVLRIADTYDQGAPPIPALGWRTMSRPGQGELDDLHNAKQFGGVQVVMQGAIDIGVTAGDLRQVTGRPGDAFVIVDTEGDGHWARRNGEENFEAINIRVAPDWERLKSGFSNWPDNAKPFTV